MTHNACLKAHGKKCKDRHAPDALDEKAQCGLGMYSLLSFFDGLEGTVPLSV